MNNITIFSLDETKILGQLLRTETSRLMIKYLMQKGRYNEELADMITLRKFRRSNTHYHLQKIKSINLVKKSQIRVPNYYQPVTVYKAKPFILIGPDEYKKKMEESKELEKVLNDILNKC